MGNSQMILGLNLSEDTTLANYFVNDENKQLLLTLHTTASGRGERLIYFWGEKGVGRTHLLQGCCYRANQLGLRALYLSLKDLSGLHTDVLEGLEALYLVGIDDIQGIVGNREWEEAFFDFFNRMYDANKRLIISGDKPLQNLGLVLPDLSSRLSSSVIFQIHSLTDEEKIQTLRLKAKKKGLWLSLVVAQFILKRCRRDLGSLFSALEKLDQASLKEQRKLTIPFVKEVLKV